MRHVLVFGLASALAVGPASVTRLSAAGPTSRSVYVTVVDDNGKPVAGLVATDFGVKEGGKDREVVSVEPATEKTRLALMVEQPLVSQGNVRAGLAEFVTRMCRAAEISLFMVTQRSERIVDFTSDPNALVAGIRSLPLGQTQWTTEVPEALEEIARSFEKARPARPVIVLAAIEQSQTTDSNPDSILKQLAKSRAQFWAVSVGGGQSTSAAGVGSLGDMAGRSQIIGDGSRQSGGRRVEVSTVMGFQRGLQQVADDLSSQYLITYRLPDGVKASERISISLKKPGATLRAPSRISDK